MTVSVVLLAEGAVTLAITESASFRSALYSAFVRVSAVAMITLFVATSMVRDIQERVIDMYLARPITRAAWYLGRLFGFSVAASMCALVAGLPLIFMAPFGGVAAWTSSLAAELVLMVAIACACVVTLGQVASAVLVSAAFYLLARAMSAIVLMASGPTVDPNAWSTPIIQQAVTWLAVVLPPLDRLCEIEWLWHGADALPVITSVAQAIERWQHNG